MIEQKPKHIICTVRGGRESRETVTRAIDQALEHLARLTIFHVIDADLHIVQVSPRGYEKLES